jgi:hypothetical protein
MDGPPNPNRALLTICTFRQKYEVACLFGKKINS